MRDSDESNLLHFGRLFQQFSVDMFVKMETQRLDWYGSQQENIRADFLQGLADAIASGEKECGQVGHRIVLPASFVGGPRHMKRKYLDAMTLVQKFGKPDLFITMTCNPNWPEIKEHLLPGELAQDRPDLAVRAFHAKLEELKMELFKKNIFGEVAAYTYVIEFQKRGLPHAHLLLILKPQFKLFKPEEFDKIVSAEIPDKEKYPHLYKLVLKHMVHGPCGEANPKNVCMKKGGVCRNSYPKQFCAETTNTTDAYPTYRRRDDGRSVKIRGAWLDNRWIVPYNAYLLAKFDCHINVEICSTIKAIKYIYKYICKGNDRIMYHIGDEKKEDIVDEIKQYVAARWVSPPEALWRIYRFTMGELKPAVIHLQLHLENYQPITFNKKQSLANVLQNPFNRKTMLTEFFSMNSTNADAQKLNCTYSEFPDHFVWLADKKNWRLRQKGNSVGRIVIAQPTEGERYYLRLLLAKVRCPKSFDDIKTYKNKIASTYREAALNRGLLEADNSQELCLQEASVFHMPYELRRLFATLLVYSCPSEPKKLWIMFEKDMCEDYIKQGKLSLEESRNLALHQVNGFLQSMGKDISLYGIVSKSYYETEEDLTRELRAEKNIIVSTDDLLSEHMLNDNQKEAFKIITERVYSNKPGSFFIDGPGGTGKTFLYRALLANVRSKGYIALATATSGIAASLLPGGRTAHSRFKIPLDVYEGSTCRVNKQTSLGVMIKEAKLILWDEAPMCKRHALEAFNDLLQDLMDSKELFGGKVVVLGGDFRQTLPVVRKGTKAETINASLICSKLWKKLERLELNENMRARLDPQFTSFLLKIGEGTQQKSDSENLKLPNSILIQHSNIESGIDELVSTVFPNICSGMNVIDKFMNRAILTTKNQYVDEINDMLIHKFPGDEIEYLSYDEAFNSQDQGQYEDLLNSLTPNGLPPHKLLLKKNAPIILLRNLDPTEGLCNGTRLICRTLSKNVLQAEIATGDFIGKQVFIHRIPLQPPNDEFYPVPYKRIQFPIRLCFAMTINKAQGQTLDFVGVYLKEPVFSHGQLYVALSRAKTAASVRVLINPTYFDKGNINITKNVVFKEVLTS